MVTKFSFFVKENINSDIDPYSEENWNDNDIEKLISECIRIVLNDIKGYKHWLKYVLRGEFFRYDINALYQFLDIQEGLFRSHAELVEECINTVLSDDSAVYKVWLENFLTNHFRKKDIEFIRDFMGINMND